MATLAASTIRPMLMVKLAKALVGAAVLSLLAVALIVSRAEAPPVEQEQFQEARAEFAKRWDGAPNALRQGVVEQEALVHAREWMRQTGGRINGWRGKVASVDDRAGRGDLLVVIESRQSGTSFSYRCSIHAEPRSKAWDALTSLGSGQSVKFSATLKPSELRGFMETSTLEGSSLLEPDIEAQATVITAM